MADYPVFKINELILDQIYLDDVLSVVLNTIFFHRALGPVQINYTRCDKLQKITQLRCGDPDVDQSIANIIQLIKLDKRVIDESQFTISLKFMEEQGTKYMFMKQKPKIFEEWLIQFKLANCTQEQTEENVTKEIYTIMEIANANYDHFDEQFDQAQTKPLKYPYQITYNVIKLVK